MAEVAEPTFKFNQAINKWVDSRLYYEGISDADFLKRKAWLFADFISLVTVIGLTVLAIVLDLKGIIIYGIALIFILVLIGIIYLTVKRNTDWAALVGQIYIIVASFFIIVHLGGIPYSGGLIINGITVILTAIILRKISWLIWLTFLYIVTIIALAFLQPFLTVPQGWTMPLNILFFVLNIIWMTVYLTMVIVQIIKYRTQVEENEKIRLKELDETKSRLFTNITHEFRTPLTVILGMVEQIKKEPEKWTERGIEKIKQNSNNLLNLVNKMLDIAKMEAGAMSLNLVQGNIIIYLKYIVESFQASASHKKINLSFASSSEHLMMDYDPEKLLSVFSNLVSNAIKFSNHGGKININISTNPKQNLFKAEVQDFGVGIPESKLPKIFDRFYQVNEKSLHHTEGTGLGLSLTKELISTMGGTIDATSKIDLGSTFKITLPITNKANYLKDPISEIIYSNKEAFSVKEHFSQTEKKREEDSSDLILIVEDNADVTEYLVSLLDHNYRIEVAENGKVGLEKARELIPDIIISDVMMPEMDGFSLLEKVKKDELTSHIPVVLLTAKADHSSKLEGLDRGADAYLTKPFKKDELYIRLKKLIELRTKLKDRYLKLKIPESTENETFYIEDNFMRKVRYIMEKNLGNEYFTINHICSTLNMSRTQLYRKFNALSDKTVNNYWRSLRLRKALELLQMGELNVTQVAFEVGFKDLSHFSQSFKEEFGYNPSEAVNQC